MFVLLHPLWEYSSAGSERLPYKQEVTGSIPVTPTKGGQTVRLFYSAEIPFPNIRLFHQRALDFAVGDVVAGGIALYLVILEDHQ